MTSSRRARSSSRRPSGDTGPAARRQAGRTEHGSLAAIHSWRRDRPTPGWQPLTPESAGETPLANPRPPAAPASLRINLEQYYTGCVLIGILGSQGKEPDAEWLTDWACDIGALAAKKARRRWRAR